MWLQVFFSSFANRSLAVRGTKKLPLSQTDFPGSNPGWNFASFLTDTLCIERLSFKFEAKKEHT